MKKILLLLSLVLMQQSFSQDFLAKGGGMGNGGHPYEIQFKSDAKEILEHLLLNKESLPEALSSINLYNLEMNIELVRIEVKSRRLKDKFGRIKSALNFPGKILIQINKNDWEKIKDKDHLRLPLVLHEFLGLSGEEVDTYDISSKYFEFLETTLEAKSLEQNLQVEKRVELLKLEGLKVSELSSYYRDTYRSYSIFSKVTMEDLEFVYGGFLLNKRINTILINVISDNAAKKICKKLGFDSSVGSVRSTPYRTEFKYSLVEDNYGVGIKIVAVKNKRSRKLYGSSYIVCAK
jgi:hypothetical protein